MKTNKGTKLLLLSVFTCLSIGVYSQVTIGDDALPRIGLVLDMKNTNATGYTGGMMPPNVAITDLRQIPSGFSDAATLSSDVTKQKDLAGMLVYNTKADADKGIAVGYYSWDGEQWKAIPTSDPVKKEGTLSTVTGRSGHSYTTCLVGTTRWMVENSKEGHHVGEAYGHNGKFHTNSSVSVPQTYGAKGYYYTWDQAAAQMDGQYDACPEGWVLPTDADFNALRVAVNADVAANPNKAPIGIAKWWAVASAFAGYYNVDLTTWYGWGILGYWWSASTAGRYYGGYAPGMNGPLTNTQYWFSVRCVQK